MRRSLQILAVAVLSVVPAFAQDRSVWRTAADIQDGLRGTVVGTVIDTDAARNHVQLQTDDDRYGRVTVTTDAVSTQYNGFGGVINGSPEIFIGSNGFANIRTGDRIEARGTGRGTGVMMADQVTLLGRSISASQVGVGNTRPATSISTPSAGPGGTADVYGRVEGVVRQVNAADNRIVVETDRRELFTIRTTSTTPVYYQNEVYHVGNLEVGDRVRVDSDAGMTSGRDIAARTIEVVENVQDRGNARTVAGISGSVTRIDRATDVVRVDTGRGEIRVDMSRASDPNGRRVKASDLRVGDRVEIAGTYSSNGSVYVASTVRQSEDVFAPAPETEPAPAEDQEIGDFVIVTLSGTVTESLQDDAMLSLRDRTTNRVVKIFVTEDFVVRTKSGGYMTADRLNKGESLVVKAYRDENGNYVAQTIRQR